MKRIVSLVAVLALTLLAVPAMAGDQSSMSEGQGAFYALSKLPTTTTESTALTQMTEDQLAASEGGDNICVVCANANVQAQILTDKSTQQTGNQTNQRGTTP